MRSSNLNFRGPSDDNSEPDQNEDTTSRKLGTAIQFLAEIVFGGRDNDLFSWFRQQGAAAECSMQALASLEQSRRRLVSLGADSSRRKLWLGWVGGW